MKKIIIIFILLFTLISCKSQEIKKSIFTQYCKEAMDDSNLLILNFGQVDSLLCTTPDFGDFFIEKANCGTKLKNRNIIRVTSIHQEKDGMLPQHDRNETLFVYKNKQVMEIHLRFNHSNTYNHSTYINSIPFQKGVFQMSYVFPEKYENLKDNSFHKNMPKDYFENKQEEIDFSNLKFNYINFSKDKDSFTWKEEKD